MEIEWGKFRRRKSYLIAELLPLPHPAEPATIQFLLGTSANDRYSIPTGYTAADRTAYYTPDTLGISRNRFSGKNNDGVPYIV